MFRSSAALVAALALCASFVATPAPAGEPDSTNHHHHGVNVRGDRAMGFSHAATTHHFILRADGGVIQVTANDEADTASQSMIHAHLAHITQRFSEGDFNLPMFIHGKVPPGVAAMKQLKNQISYHFEPIESGGRVTIRTRNARALVAIHDFLRFQIQDHKTGDPLEVLVPQPE